MVLSFFAGVAVAAGVLAWQRATDEQAASLSQGVERGRLGAGKSGVNSSRRSVDYSKEAREALARFGESADREQLSAALTRWAEKDGSAAAAWAEEMLPEKVLPVQLHDILAVWIVRDQDGVIEWYREGLDEKGRHRAKVESISGRHTLPELIVRWLAMLNPARSATFMMEDLYKGESQHLFYSEPTRDLTSVLRSSSEFREVCEALVPYYERYGRHMGETNAVLNAWREVDPPGAARFSEEYPVPGVSQSSREGE